LTWAACECGCGFEGEDHVTQYLIEEAVMLRLELEQRPKPSERAVSRSLERRQRIVDAARRAGC